MFVCVLRSGGIYTPKHVERLQKQLDRPLTCLSDLKFTMDGVKVLPLFHSFPGWWSKIEIFRLQGPIVYLDLDVDISGNPDELYTKEFTMWVDPLYPTGFNSSVMSWSKTPTNIYHKFLTSPDKFQRAFKTWPKAGDQGFIQEYAPEVKGYSEGLIRSYRAYVKDHGIDDNTVVVAYHGKPKPWDL